MGGGPLYPRTTTTSGGPAARRPRALEKLTLEGFQSGLSWIVILRKRPAFRAAFADFEPEAVAAFGDDDVARLLADDGIVRNRQKIEAAIGNARAVAALRRARRRRRARPADLVVPARRAGRARPADGPRRLPGATSASKALAKALKREGLTFVGPTTMYALMQSAGLVDDHVAGCWRAEGADR